jgi:branched-chain amino acid aminotransferase
LAEEAGLRVKELNVPREMIYVAEELFFTGTAAEITPIRTVDHAVIGNGKPGPITLQLQKTFFDIVKNANDPHQWLEFVYKD